LQRQNAAGHFRQSELRYRVVVTDKPAGGDIMMETGMESA
jgi:hypothetical protein